MKNKLLVAAALFVIVISSSACKKTFGCTCEKTDGSTEHFDIKGSDESDAEAQCVIKKTASSTYTVCSLD